MDSVEQWRRADSGTAKAVAGNRLVAEIKLLREVAAAVYTNWACGEPTDKDMKALGELLGFEVDVP